MSQDTMDKLRELKDRLRDPATYDSHGWCEWCLEEVFKLLDALIASLE
jgi:sugar (pentulose or hexulose) kinase